ERANLSLASFDLHRNPVPRRPALESLQETQRLSQLWRPVCLSPRSRNAKSVPLDYLRYAPSARAPHREPGPPHPPRRTLRVTHVLPTRKTSLPPDLALRTAARPVPVPLLVLHLVWPPPLRHRNHPVLRRHRETPSRATRAGPNRRTPRAPAGRLSLVSQRYPNRLQPQLRASPDSRLDHGTGPQIRSLPPSAAQSPSRS